MAFDKCLFEILAKLAASELTALCNYIDGKVAILDRQLNTALAFTNVNQDQFIQLEAKLRAGEDKFEESIRNSPLLSVASNLGPSCSALSVFTGPNSISEAIKTSVNDVEYVARQLATVDGLIQTAKNQLEEEISALHDLCRIVQLIVLQNANATTAGK